MAGRDRGRRGNLGWGDTGDRPPRNFFGPASVYKTMRYVAFLFLAVFSITPVSAADSPTLVSPASGSALSPMEATLVWDLPAGSDRVHVQVTPAGGDGPGVGQHFRARGMFALEPVNADNVGRGRLKHSDARVKPGHHQNCCRLCPAYRLGLAAALGLPHALAGAVAAAPGAAAALPSEMAGAGRGLVAGADIDDHRAILADLARDAHGRGAGIA